MSEHKFKEYQSLELDGGLPMQTGAAIRRAIHAMAVTRAPMFREPYPDEALSAIVSAVCDDTRKAIEACFKAVESKMELKPPLQVQKILAEQAYGETIQ